jgi:hypothetical protein
MKGTSLRWIGRSEARPFLASALISVLGFLRSVAEALTCVVKLGGTKDSPDLVQSSVGEVSLSARSA